jgi:hypothetical protein
MMKKCTATMGGATVPTGGEPQERENLGWATTVPHSSATVLEIHIF